MRQLLDKRGQAMIEFAIIIPFFALMLYGFAYVGMFFHDYITLTELARDIARRESVGIAYDQTKYNNTALLTDVYKFNPAKDQGVKIVSSTDATAGKQITVTLAAQLNMTNSFWKSILPASISASLTMRKEE